MNEENWLSRTELLLGKQNLKKLQNAHILVAGLGGVGAYAAEAICRAGIGQLTIVDSDRIMPSNRNRQLPALKSTEGRLKTEVMAERLLDINPDLNIMAFHEYLVDEKIEEILNFSYDYVIDAIDTLSPKIFLIKYCVEKRLQLVSSMGSGGRFDPLEIRIADVSESYGCKLAQVVRKKLHGWKIDSGFKVVFSPEPILKDSVIVTDNSPNKKSTVGTISYMPAMFGLASASVVIRSLIGH